MAGIMTTHSAQLHWWLVHMEQCVPLAFRGAWGSRVVALQRVQAVVRISPHVAAGIVNSMA